MVWLDSYERRARLIPGLVLVAPIAVTIVMFGFKDDPLVAWIVGALTAFGAPVVLANFVRHKGLEVEDHLYQSWGGKPTDQLLQGGQPAQRDSWRAAVEAVSGRQLPTLGQPDAAGQCDAAVKVVISKTRSGFKLLFNENRNYGYERNLYGLRKLGRSVAGGCLGFSAIAVGLLIGVAHRKTRAEWVIGLIALAGLMLLWIFLPSEKRTRTTAFKYAGQLFDAAVELTVKS